LPIAKFEFYITVSFYDEDPTRPGEVFIVVAKEGSTLGGLCDALGLTISLALQHGVPWESLSRKYKTMRFEPSGRSGRWDVEYGSLMHAISDTVDHLISEVRGRWNDKPESESKSTSEHTPTAEL